MYVPLKLLKVCFIMKIRSCTSCNAFTVTWDTTSPTFEPCDPDFPDPGLENNSEIIKNRDN